MILEAVVWALVLGVGAQIVAERFRLPAILPLLGVGILAGPAGVGLFDPHHLGEGLEVVVHLGVAVILFEGGLSLDLRQLSRVGGAVRNLLTVGVVITTLGGAYLAHAFAGLPWTTAWLFGSIVMVTGPTVIAPLLRHLLSPQRVKVILTSEGLLIDAIGATAAYFVLQWVERAGMPLESLAREVTGVGAVGLVVGFAAGSLARAVVKTRLVGAEIRNLALLAILLLAYLTAEHQAPQSGILMAVVMGVVLSAGKLPDLAKVKVFKGQLTVLLISFVFVLLAAQLDIQAVLDLGWSGLAVAAGLILVVRPASVFASILPSQLDLRERTVLALLAPRGIVAAAVASLAALALNEAGIEGGGTLEALVYLVILVTGAWATIMALVLPRALGYLDDPSRRRAVLVGAHRLNEELAGVLARDRRSVSVVDAVPWRLDRFRDLGHRVVVGDAREAASYEEAEIERDTLTLAATTNDELNLLVAELAHAEFGIEHPVVLLKQPPEDFGTRSRAWAELLGARGVDVAVWNRRLEKGDVEAMDLPLDADRITDLLDAQRRWPREILVLCGWTDTGISFRVAPDQLADLESATLLTTPGKGRAFLAAAAQAASAQPESGAGD